MTHQTPEHLESSRWAGDLGARWNRHREQFEGMIREVGEVAITHAGFRPGERVVDVGCGAGPSSLRIAELVGPDGQVTGLDISGPLLETARERAARQGLNNLAFVLGDAATIQLRDYDHLFSRFGVMFFDQPRAAFANMRAFLKPGGRVTLACWGPPQQNPWAFETLGILRRHLELPPPQPRAPGPFALGDPEYLQELLNAAGFAELELSSWSGEQLLGGPGASPQEAADFLLQATSVSDLLPPESAELRATIRADIASHLESYLTTRGVALNGTIWLVRARA